MGIVATRIQVSTWARHQIAYRLRGKPRPRFVFIHVPKTAGVSVGKYFRSCFGLLNTGRSVSLGDTPFYPADGSDKGGSDKIALANRANYVGGHMSWAQVERLDSSRPNFRFTFLREPASRLWSLYDYFTDYPERHRPSGLVEFVSRCHGMPPDQFFTSNDPEIVARVDNYMVRQLATSVRNYPVGEQDWPELTARAKTNLASLDFVGFQDSFDDDFGRLLRLTNLPAPERVPHMNRSVKRPRSEPSPAVVEAMDRLSKWDRELYDFARTLRDHPAQT
jgi:hypothetical protein